jgi:hypothetical protein
MCVIWVKQAQNLIELTLVLATLNLRVGVRKFNLVYSIINMKALRKIVNTSQENSLHLGVSHSGQI